MTTQLVRDHSDADTAVPAPSGTTWSDGLGDVVVMTHRNLRRVRRSPRLLAISSIQPVLFVLLFRYVFGDAISTPTDNYANYFVPGILVHAILFGGTTAVALAADLSSGTMDRFRCLPIARSTVLAARTIADTARAAIVVALVLATGLAVGFRFNNGLPQGVAAIALVLAFGFAVSWASAFIGLVVNDPETAQIAAGLPLFPLLFASSLFVPVDSMPDWLAAFARNQPISAVVDSVRSLTQGGPVHHHIWQALVWIAGILIVFVPLTIRQYRRIET